MQAKNCPSCGKDKPLSDFGVDRSREDGLHLKCKECVRAYAREWARKSGKLKPEGWVRKTADKKAYAKAYRQANPEKFKAYERKHKRTPEQERAKYVRKMIALHGEGWVPRGPKQTPEERKKKQRESKAALVKKDGPARVKYLARKKTNKAIQSGKLERGPCAVCGSTEGIEAHHTDYSRPMDVVWLCAEHHREEHRKS